MKSQKKNEKESKHGYISGEHEFCPKCDEGMRYIPNHDFYGCNDYPGCNGTRQHDIVTDEEGEALFYFHVVRIANS